MKQMTGGLLSAVMLSALTAAGELQMMTPDPASWNASASASYNSNRSADKAIFGAGLAADGTHTAAAAENYSWMTDREPRAVWIMTTFPESHGIGGVKIWNFNWKNGNTDYNNRGFASVLIYVSDADTGMDLMDSSVWRQVTDSPVPLNKATDLDTYAGEELITFQPVQGRRVLIQMASAFPDVNAAYYGLSEIRYYEETDFEVQLPEPPLVYEFDPPCEPEPATGADIIDAAAARAGVLVEAEAFETKGGWVVDPQFVDVMGSPYLLAHGKGVPVDDAKTHVDFPRAGAWQVWVRTRDWIPDWTPGEGEVKPGRFRIAVGTRVLGAVLGAAPSDWGWVKAGTVTVEDTASVLVTVKDLDGFEGRFDAVWFTQGEDQPPSGAEKLAAWRALVRGESVEPETTVEADLVVVGGGIAGTAAAIAAAEGGLTVALVQDRPMLGGNASDEIRVRTERAGKEYHWIVDAIKNTKANSNSMAADDLRRMTLVRGYPSIKLFTGWRAYGVKKDADGRLVAVDARQVETAARTRFAAPLFVDTTGDGWIGYWAGAAYRIGREAKSEYDEQKFAQTAADTSTMGNSLLWTTTTGAEDSVFPSVPWALPVSRDRAASSGDWKWEAGLDPEEDTIYGAEKLRDRLFRAIYGSFWTFKQAEGNEKRVLDWVPYIAGKRESRRLIGDYVVRESDIAGTPRAFEDAIGIATWSIDLHFYDAGKYVAGGENYLAATVHNYVDEWWMPYRSLCCRDVPNLFMAGRCASYTHVAFGSSRVMNAGGQQGVAVGYAASLCRKYGCLPRAIYQDKAKTEELQELINSRQVEKGKALYNWPRQEAGFKPNADIIVDNADATGVTTGGTGWSSSTYDEHRYGKDYLVNKTPGEEQWIAFTPDLPAAGAYDVYLYWCGSYDAQYRCQEVPCLVTYDGGTEELSLSQLAYSQEDSGVRGWQKIGRWTFAAGTTGRVKLTNKNCVDSRMALIGDAVRFVSVAGEETVISADQDANGLPDDWERRYFLQTTGTDPQADADHDGFTNLEEYLADTDPLDANSVFRIADTGLEASSDSLSVAWKSVPGRTYRLWRAESLPGDFLPVGEPIRAESDTLRVTIPMADTQAFYKVGIQTE